MMTDSEIKEFKDLYDSAETYPDRITPWEREFLDSIRDRIEYYGEETFLSEKQEHTLKRIENKVYST